MNHNYDIIIIGAGAAGLLLASRTNLAAAGRTGLILEATSLPGTKLRMTGAGHCNFTHAGSVKEMVACYGPHSKAIRRALYRYNNDSFREHMVALGLPSYARNDGRVFPRCEDGEQVRRALLSRARENGFELKTDSAVHSISGSANALNGVESGDISASATTDALARNTQIADQRSASNLQLDNSGSSEKSGRLGDAGERASNEHVTWRVICADSVTYETSHLVIATGGKSYPSTGSNGHMWKILERDLGIRIVPPRPALAPISVADYPYSELAGLSFPNVLLSVTAPGRKIQRSQGDLLLTHHSFSGPAALNLSADTLEGDKLHINYLPDIPAEEVTARITKAFAAGKGSPANVLASLFGLPKRFCEVVIARSTGTNGHYDSSAQDDGHRAGRCTERNALFNDGGSQSKETRDTRIAQTHRNVNSYDGLSPRRVSSVLADDIFTITGEADWNVAMATRGGIDLGELDLKTMEFREHPGLYAIGEALDVDGRTGGYNLQFAYSSAAVCAEALTERIF